MKRIRKPIFEKIEAGMKVFNWEILSEFDHPKYTNRYWICQCSCGSKPKPVQETMLKYGDSKSCCHVGKTTHGHSRNRKRSPYLAIWTDMINRCHSPSRNSFINYGGRGITVCERWRNSFESFLEDMGERPSEKHSLDRIDNSLGYFKENCRWATNKEQARNTRRNRMIEIDGQRRCVSEWAEIYGISPDAIYSRIDYLGWNEEDAVKKPVRVRNWNRKRKVVPSPPVKDLQ